MTDITKDCDPVCSPAPTALLPVAAPASGGSTSTVTTPDYDTMTLCDPANSNAPVVVVTTYSATGVPTSAFYTVAGAVWAGVNSTLVACGGGGSESDPIAWCSSGLEVTQWVVKNAGQPTGIVYWTNAAGAVIAAPAIGPTLIRGVCAVADLTKAGASVAQVVNPSVPMQGLTVFNYTTNLVRGIVTLTAGITGTNAVGLRTFLVPPGGSYSVDFADHAGDNASGAIDAIDSVSFSAVLAGVATAEASTLATNGTTVAGSLFINFASA
jgi:hypothetical protein